MGSLELAVWAWACGFSPCINKINQDLTGRVYVGGFTPAKSGRPREKAKGNIRQDLSGRGNNEGGTAHTTQDAKAQKNNKTVYSSSLMRESQIYKEHLKEQGIQL